MASPQTLQCPWIDSPSSSGEEGAVALLLPLSLTGWKSLLPQVPAPEVPPKPVPAPLPTAPTLFLGFNPNPPLTLGCSHRHTNPIVENGQVHPCQKVIQEVRGRGLGFGERVLVGGCGVGVSRYGGTWGVVRSPSPWLPVDPCVCLGLHRRGALEYPPVPPGSWDWGVEGEI